MIKNPFKKKPETSPEDIANKAVEQSKLIEAEIEARAILSKARRKRDRKSLSSWIVSATAFVFLGAAVLISTAGYWYDILFYSSQSDDLAIIVGLIAFSLVARSCDIFIPVVLDATKPNQKDDDKSGFLKFVQLDPKHRKFLYVLFAGSVAVCSIPSLSFFIAGHDSSTQTKLEYDTSKTDFDDDKTARIKTITDAQLEAKEARDLAVSEAQKTIDAVKDETPSVSADDNITLQLATASKNQAIDDYKALVDENSAAIQKIQSEKYVPSEGVERPHAKPFGAVYRLFAQAVGTETIWATILGVFFAAMFELFCLALVFLSFILLKVLPRAAQAMEMRHAADHVNAQIRLDRLQADIELGALHLKDELDREKLQAEIEAMRLDAQKSKEKAEANIEIAKREREAEKAQQHAEALKDGKAWIDPDKMVEAEADRQRAIQDSRMRELAEISSKLRSGKITVHDLDENGDLLPKDGPRKPKSQIAKEFYADAVNSNKISLPENFEEDAA